MIKREIMEKRAQKERIRRMEMIKKEIEIILKYREIEEYYYIRSKE